MFSDRFCRKLIPERFKALPPAYNNFLDYLPDFTKIKPSSRCGPRKPLSKELFQSLVNFEKLSFALAKASNLKRNSATERPQIKQKIVTFFI